MGKDIGFCHRFPAVRGMQAGRPCYIAMCPMRIVPKLFVFDEGVVPPELRAQRILNTGRIPELSSYIVENVKDYTLSSLTASIDGQVEFEAISDKGESANIGTLTVSMEAQILINDGQHRRAAIETAIAENPELAHDNISVLFFIDEGLARSQQMFADLNKHAVRPSDSISTLYDHREDLSKLARYVQKHVKVFSRLTEMERSSISNRSTKLFTLSSIKGANKTLLSLGKNEPVSKEAMILATEYWTRVTANMPDWQLALKKEVIPSELREQYVHAHGVTLQAIAHVGVDLIARTPKSQERYLKKLRTIDWARANNEWEGRAMVQGRISKAHINVRLTTNYIKNHLALALNPDEQEAEEAFLR